MTQKAWSINKSYKIQQQSSTGIWISLGGSGNFSNWYMCAEIVLRKSVSRFSSSICIGLSHFLVLHCDCAIYRLKVCGNLDSCKSISAILPTAFAHFMTLKLYFDNSHGLSNFSIIFLNIFYGDLWSVTFDVTIITNLAHHKMSQY